MLIISASSALSHAIKQDTSHLNTLSQGIVEACVSKIIFFFSRFLLEQCGILSHGLVSFGV